MMATESARPVTIVDASKPRIRIAFVIDNLSRAGTESQLLALIRNLDRRQFEPTLILLDGESPESRQLEPDNCVVQRLGVRKLLGRKSLRAWWALRRQWQQQQPDIVQCYFLDSSLFAIPLARICGVKRVLQVRNNLGYWLTFPHRLRNRFLRTLVHQTLTNSEAGREQFLREGHAADSVVVLGNGVDLAPYRDETGSAGESIRKTSPVIGCVANLRTVKNIDGLMRVARLVRESVPGAVFRVAGEGDQRPQLEQMRRELGLESAFELPGSVNHVPGFLRAIDLAVLPSHSEGMSNALLEYMAAGKPIVATDVGANRQVLGETGVLVPPGDDQALATAIVALLRDTESARQRGRQAQERAEQEFSREAMVRKFEDYYRKSLSGQS